MSLRVRAIRGLASAVYYSGLLGAGARVAGRLRLGSGVPILTFHRVNDEADPFFPSMPTAVFAARMEYVARNYVVLPVEEIAERLRMGTVPTRALAVTFDDGYRDTLTHAAPILARYGLGATVFLATGFIGTADAPWYDRLAGAVKVSEREAIELEPGDAIPVRGQRLRALQSVLQRLKQVPDDVRRTSVERLIKELDPADGGRQKRLMLSWDEVDALCGLGFSIGAHTVGHPILSRLGPEAAWREIHGSKRAIEEATGRAVRAFAYPNGGATDYDETTVELVEKAGFTCAVTTRRGVNTPKTPRFELHRGGPWEQHLPTYAMKLFYYEMSGA